jgi:hypothetical protein
MDGESILGIMQECYVSMASLAAPREFYAGTKKKPSCCMKS